VSTLSIRPRLGLFSLCLMALLPAFANPDQPTTPTPPVAAKVPFQMKYHGQTMVDDYRWLHQKQKSEVINYLQAENKYTEAITAHLTPLKDKIYQEMKGRLKETDLSVPYRDGPYYYYSRTEAGKQYPIYCRRAAKPDHSYDANAPEEILLDKNKLAVGKKFFAIGDFVVSPNHQLLAYTTDSTGFRQYQLHIKNLKTGKLLKDTLPRITSLAWANDNQTLFAVQEDATTKRSDRLSRLSLGKAVKQVYHETDVEFSLNINKTRDGQLIVFSLDSTNTSEVKLLDARQPQGQFMKVLGRTANHRYSVEHRAGMLYIMTNRDAKNFRLVRAPLATPDASHWESIIEHDPKVLLEDMHLFQDFMVVGEKTMAQTRQRIYDFAKNTWQTIQFDEPVYVIYADNNPEFTSKQFRLSFQSPITPRTLLEVNMADGSQRQLKQQEVRGFDPKQFESRRLWVEARDKVQVPMWAVYKKGIKFDGSAPLLLYAYGSYGVASEPHFVERRLSLLERGVIFVTTQVRGGNEMGEAWHDDGMLMKKKNTFNDFIDSAQYLIQNNWTRADRLIAEGGSAGGLLMGAVSNMRPDLFHAVHASVPFVDVINSMMTPDLPGTTREYPEWGNPNQKAAFDYMLSYSPYDNIERKAYPTMLVTTGLNDSQVMYWEPAKYVAKLRAHKTDKNKLLLKTNMGAGHGGASGRYDALAEKAFEAAWMLDQWGIKE
jgi:oligopeptidase B